MRSRALKQSARSRTTRPEGRTAKQATRVGDRSLHKCTGACKHKKGSY